MEGKFTAVWAYIAYLMQKYPAKYDKKKAEMAFKYLEQSYDNLKEDQQGPFAAELAYQLTVAVEHSDHARALCQILIPEIMSYAPARNRDACVEHAAIAALAAMPENDAKGFFRNHSYLIRQDAELAEYLPTFWAIPAYDNAPKGRLFMRVFENAVLNEDLGDHADEVSAGVLRQLLEKSQARFWTLSEKLRAKNPDRWTRVIIECLSDKDREAHKGIRIEDKESADAIACLIKYAVSKDKVPYVTRPLGFLTDLLSKSPRKLVLDAWKKIDTNGLDAVTLMRLSRWLNEQLPGREEGGSIEITEHNLNERCLVSQNEKLF